MLNLEKNYEYDNINYQKEGQMLPKNVETVIKSQGLIQDGDSIVVGVSGGPDSVYLLYLLNSLKKKFDLKLTIAHLDHMLRRDSPKDAEFVRKLGLKLDIPVVIGRINVKLLSRKGSLEEIARDARLRFLFKVAKDIKAKKIALAHNLDDQAETVLMRIIRGTGLFGLSGILAKKEMGGFIIIRPLIKTRRKDIENFLRKSKIATRIDKSNLMDIYFRNKVRNKLIPLLEKEYNPQIKEILSNLADNSAQDYDFLNTQALRLVKERFGRVKLAQLIKLHPAMRRLVLRLNIKKLQGSTRRISFTHIKEIEDLIINRPTGSIVDLPKGISIIKRVKSLIFYHR